MPLVATVTVVLAALLVAALAFYLMWVIVILRSVDHTLGDVTFGVRAVAHRTEPLDSVLTDVNHDLAAVADALEDLVETASAPPAKAS